MSNWVDVGEGAFFRSRWVFNCFVVPGAANGRPLVVDLGLPSHADAFCQRWSESPVVVATHLHLDHVGGVPTLEARRPTELAVSDRVRDYQAGTTPEGPRSSTVAKILPVLRSQRFSIGALVELARLDPVGYGLRGPLVMPCQTLRYLENGPCAFAEGWEVIRTPGHTGDSISMYHPDSYTLCSGDAVLSYHGTAWFNPERWSDDATAATEDRLRSLRVDRLLPGHGRPVFGRDLLAHAVSATTAQGWIPRCRAGVGRAVRAARGRR